MKKWFCNKRFTFGFTVALALAMLTLSFGAPVKNASFAINAVAEEVNETSSEDIVLTQTAGEEVVTEGTVTEDLEIVTEDASTEETEEKLSFTERIAAKFASSLGQYVPREVVVLLVSMMPILELRAGLFVAKFLDMPLLEAIPICIVGNIIPIPLILLFIKKIFKWMGKTKLFHKLIEKLEARAMKKSSALANGEFVGLMLFVGIPIPGTGAWMGSLIAALLEVDFKKAIVAELVGIAIATVIVSILSYGLLGMFI
jgi:uncharacterized membrane protein